MYSLIAKTKYKWLLPDKLLSISCWKGFIRSIGKCYTYQNNYLPWMTPDYVWCTLVPKWRELGELAPPGGKDITYQYDENVCDSNICHSGGLVIRVSGGNELPEMEWWGVLQDLIPDVGQLVVSQVHLEEWVMYMDKHGLPGGPCNAMCLPAHNEEAVHIDGVSCGLTVLVDVGWTLRCSFSLSPQVLPDSPIYSSSQSAWVHLNWYITPLFWEMVSLSFGAIDNIQMVLLPLKFTCIPRSLHVFLKLLLRPLV